MSEELEQTGKLLIYQNEKGNTRVDVYFKEETKSIIWFDRQT